MASGEVSDKFSDAESFEFQAEDTVVPWKLKK
jgi:hypothetical protein